MQATWLNDGAPISGETLRDNGVLHRTLSTDPALFEPVLAELCKERGYVARDEVRLSPASENFAAICEKFAEEHLHTEDEARFILDGAGIFDIRSEEDRWMNVVVEAGDLLVVPAHRYHRFLLTDAQRVHAVRLFQDPSGWTPIYRNGDD